MFAFKGNLYSKMFIYLIKEDKEFTSKSLENKLLQELIKLRIKYKIQILILLTHADTYCNIVKADGNEKWKETCKEKIEGNKKILLDYLNSEIKKYDINNFQIQENDIRHICLVESENPKTDEEIIKGFDPNTLMMYNNAKSKEEKKMIIQIYSNISNSKNNDVKDKDYPKYDSAVTSFGNINIDKDTTRTVNKQKQHALESFFSEHGQVDITTYHNPHDDI